MQFEKRYEKRRYSCILRILLLCLFAFNTFAERRCNADPDFISSGISYSGVPQVKVGDYLELRGFFVGAMVVVRNERRFNQAALPNHNWRGLAVVGYTLAPKVLAEKDIGIVIGLEHESAHPTMGIEEEFESCYDAVYDGSYRRYMLNSVLLSVEKGWAPAFFEGHIKADYQFYFHSKNTPELASQSIGIGNGISAGVDVSASAGKGRAFVSVFDRYLFKGCAQDVGRVHSNDGAAITCAMTSWPVFNQVNTMVIKAGYTLPVFDGGRRVSAYGSLLYGTPFGFVDSREIRVVWRVGLEIGK